MRQSARVREPIVRAAEVADRKGFRHEGDDFAHGSGRILCGMPRQRRILSSFSPDSPRHFLLKPVSNRPSLTMPAPSRGYFLFEGSCLFLFSALCPFLVRKY